jgi:acyl carrier protein
MASTDTFERVKKIIVEQLGVEENEVTQARIRSTKSNS